MLRLLSFASLAILASCSDPFGPNPGSDALLQTASAAYVLTPTSWGWEVQIPYSYDNRTGGRIYIVNCGGFVATSLERKTQDGWRIEWAPVVATCLSPPVIIEAGAQYSDTLRVTAGTFGSQRAPQFRSPDATGIYRLRWDDALTSYQDKLPFGEPLPIEWRVSNEFSLQQR